MPQHRRHSTTATPAYTLTHALSAQERSARNAPPTQTRTPTGHRQHRRTHRRGTGETEAHTALAAETGFPSVYRTYNDEKTC